MKQNELIFYPKKMYIFRNSCSLMDCIFFNILYFLLMNEGISQKKNKKDLGIKKNVFFALNFSYVKIS